ncbi:MAG: DAK2 domain-containing protein [Anaeroplasmataceae bacterium]|nr:DAK2 domain-containing protein [Anaeroplasmataceae bacterium]
MVVSSISVALFKKMVMNGAINLKNNHKKVDDLNVFPVPDGDTGTNMSMTVMSGVREMNSCESSSIIEVGKVLSRGALMGARGNSGVILSQFFRGVYVGMQNLDHNELTVEDFMNCLDSGCKVAYKAVMEPVEGTILTVVREAAENTKSHLKQLKTINELLEYYLQEAQKSLNNTPNLLPVLKEAGVVDSGGAGFLEIIQGMIMALNGQMLEATEDSAKQTSAAGSLDVEIKYGYCTEFILDLKDPQNFDEKSLKSVLSMMGDSLVVVKDENICKVHVHTNFPGRALDAAQKHGEFITLKIENMRLQHSNLKEGAKEEQPKEPKKNMAIVAVCFGDGISQTFKDLGVDYIIEGGQTMNPSTEAFVDACKKIHADNIIIIPNNGNVVMAAEQAANLINDAKVEVLKAKTISQGYASLMCFDPEGTLEANLEAMSEAVEHVKTGEITYSIRDTEIGGVKINSGDFMAIANGDIIASKESQDEALKTLLHDIVDEESQIVTFFCGNDAKEAEMENLEDICKELNAEVEVEIIEGRQDIYSYIIAVE